MYFFSLAGSSEQIVIRTCTVTKLLDTDTSHSSFTLKLENGNDIQVVSGLIASCKEDGCNEGTSLFPHKYYSKIYLIIFHICSFYLWHIV